MTALPHHIDRSFGELRGPAIGLALREAVRRNMLMARKRQLTCVRHTKITGGRVDVYTDVDLDAQLNIVGLGEIIPGVGFLGEEGGVDLDELSIPEARVIQEGYGSFLFIPCTILDRQLYVVGDGIDGTRAYDRGQGHGVATQLALIELIDGQWHVLSAWIGDINNGAVFGYRPGSAKVHRIIDFDFEVFQRLDLIDRDVPLADQNAILRRRPEEHTPLIARMLARPHDGGVVKDILVDNGSMTLTASRLWAGEVGLFVMEANPETPWDTAPLVGIMRALGFVSLRPDEGGRALVPYDFHIGLKVIDRPCEVVWVHATKEEELRRRTGDSGR